MNKTNPRCTLKKLLGIISLSLFFFALGFLLGQAKISSFGDSDFQIQFYSGILPKYFLSDQEQILYLLPTEEAPEAKKLSPYTLVNCYDRAVYEGEAWLYVDTPVFDIPAPNAKGWVKESRGIQYTDEVQPLLVFPLYLREETEYSDQYVGPLLIEERKEGQVYLAGAAGWANWIAIEDLRYPDVEELNNY